MSHGPSDEPNLTPLLDVVLQLLMFFMMCVNFVTEQINEDIKLPNSQSARPMDKSETDVLFLNLKPFQEKDYKDRLSAETMDRLTTKFRENDPCVLVVGKEPMKPSEMSPWLRQQFDDAKRNSTDGKTVNTAVIIRADGRTDYLEVFKLLQTCKVVGYTKLKLRAKQISKVQT
jgi:biopolymer transport protein ExbD